MGALAEIILSFLNLLEAEGKALRKGAVKAGLALALVALVTVLLIGGLGLIVWSVYLYLRLKNSAPTAAVLDGLFTLVLAGCVTWIAQKIAK